MTQPDCVVHEQQQQHVPLAHFRFSKTHMATMPGATGTSHAPVQTQAQRVYAIKCRPQVSPLDVNMAWLMERDGWNGRMDRLRYSAEAGVFLRKFDPSHDRCVIVQLSPTMNLTLYGNDQQMCDEYFANVFLGGPMDVQHDEMQVMARGWSDSPHDVLYFCGSVHTAFGAWGEWLVEQQLQQQQQPQ